VGIMSLAEVGKACCSGTPLLTDGVSRAFSAATSNLGRVPASSGWEAAVRARDRTIRVPSDCSGEVGFCSERPCLVDFEELRSRPAYGPGG
jgi:hypothetical protein